MGWDIKQVIASLQGPDTDEWIHEDQPSVLALHHHDHSFAGF